jgi:4-carboxymuconolactone decarboxylase
MSSSETMARTEEVAREQLSPRQQQLYDHFLKTRVRSKLSGPFSVLIHTPDIAEPTDALVEYFRHKAKIGRRLVELAILLVVRSASAQYAWSVHEPQGLQQGFSQDVIDAIRDHKRPHLERDDEKLVYEFVTELLANKTVSPAMFDRAKTAFGVDGTTELVTLVGSYVMIGLVLNVFDIPPQPGVPPLT